MLRFDAVWEDKTPFGERQQFVVHFFLSDDTVEVRAVSTKNMGRDPYPRLLNRGPLPKAMPKLQVGTDKNKDLYYAATDLKVGSFLNVFGRQLLLIDCDDFTRAWYVQNAHESVTKVSPPRKQGRTHVRAPVPPYTGIGSEEDSLASCLHLVPRPVQADLKKFIEGNDEMLRFRARMTNPQPGDETREFVIQYYLVDDTIAVFEPPSRNSGVVGGRFMDRARYKKAATEREMEFVRVTATPHIARLQDQLLWKIKSRTSNGPGAMLRSFKRFGGLGQDMNYATFQDGVFSVGITDMSEEDQRALFNSYDPDHSGHIDFSEFVKEIMKDKHAIIPGMNGARWYRPSDLRIGAKLKFMYPRTGAETQEFEITSTDGFTRKLMEESPERFPSSDWAYITSNLARVLSEQGVDIRRAYATVDETGVGSISIDDFVRIVVDLSKDHNLIAEGTLTDEDLEALRNHYDTTRDGRIQYEEFFAALSLKDAGTDGFGDPDYDEDDEESTARRQMLQPKSDIDYEDLVAQQQGAVDMETTLKLYVKRFASLFFVRRGQLLKRCLAFDVKSQGLEKTAERKGRVQVKNLMELYVRREERGGEREGERERERGGGGGRQIEDRCCRAGRDTGGAEMNEPHFPLCTILYSIDTVTTPFLISFISSPFSHVFFHPPPPPSLP